jgi:predicted exporter
VLSRLVQRAAALRWAAAILLLMACAILVEHRASLWNDKISSLSPVSQADVALDASLRADMGVSDVRYLVVVSGASRETVLRTSEQVSTILQTQVDQGELAGFESPSRYLPSTATQRARQASIPSPAVLETRLAQAVQGLPVRAQLFTPFLADIAAARRQPLLKAADLEQTSMAMAVDALLIQQDHHWRALLPLTAPEDVGINTSRIRAALSTTGLPNVLLMDMKAEFDRLYSGYLHEAILLSLGGLVAIIGLLLVVFRSPMRVARIIAPLAAAVITVTAGLALFGQQLIILHLVGLLLVVAVGSNYALFFDRADHPLPSGEGAMAEPKQIDHSISPRTLASMLFASLTTVAGFGLLAFSNVSILQAMGVTVAPGVILALIYSAIFARQPNA